MLSKIKIVAKQKGIPLYVLEEEAGLARGSISKWDKVSPTARSLKKVADLLSVTVDELLNDANTSAVQ